ncbi:DUF2808 domain-containing protein [Anthocerotibacter panamensis]|uniref:DUF2808 domain-containing protein n=1 Tax=Anthocerotibacter panamensis TaxID=2857077 RepID=UPI001C40881B|nr:DUF2808 domain-containing protein [Anthocerotibacter panamensis]
MNARLISTLLLLGALGLTGPIAAQSGFVLFGAKDPSQVLNYRLSKDRAGAQLTSYDLQIKPQKVAIRQVQVLFPERYAKSFDPNSIELRNTDGDALIPVAYAQLDPESLSLTIAAKDPIPSETALTLRLRNVTNPRAPGIHRLRARVLGTEPNAIYRFVGDWFISLN